MYRLIIILALFSSCTRQAYLFTSFHEPANEGLRLMYSYDGYKWADLNKIFIKPEVGVKIMRDPSLVRAKDGTFYLVWTCAWTGEKGFGYASSKDLVNWSAQQFIPVMKDEPGTVNVWAPEIFYDDIKDQYQVFWASTIPGRFARGVESDSNNHRIYIVTTKDFKEFSKPAVFLDPGYSVIDATINKRGEHDYVMIVKDNTRPNRNIKVAFAKEPGGPFSKLSEPFTEQFTEGPSMVKVKSDWLIYFDSYRNKTYNAVRTKDFKSFEDVSKEISVPQGHKHGTIISVPKKLIKKLKTAQ